MTCISDKFTCFIISFHKNVCNSFDITAYIYSIILMILTDCTVVTFIISSKMFAFQDFSFVKQVQRREYGQHIV